jgi:hypothetical protein
VVKLPDPAILMLPKNRLLLLQGELGAHPFEGFRNHQGICAP